MKIGQLFVELALKDAEFKQGLKDNGKSIQAFGGNLSKFAQTIDKTVTRAFQGATLAIAAFGAASAKTGAEFEQAITTVGAVANASVDGVDRLEAKARELGASTLFTATEAANAMQSLARASLEVNEIIAASGPAMLLAGSSGATMSQATNLLASTMAQFSLSASQSSHIADVFSTALRKSLFDVSSLTEAMKYAGTVGAGFGMSLEETTAAVAQFRNLGLEGSMAGTQLRMMMARAAKPTGAAKKALAELNLTVEDINPEFNSFADIMQKVGDAGMTTSQSLAIFGQRAGTAVGSIAKQFAMGSKDYEDLFQSLQDSAGSTQELYDQMTDTVLGQSKIVISALEELMLSVFDTYRGPLKDLLSELSSVIQEVARVFQHQSGLIGRAVSDNLGSLTEWIAENKFEIAATFVVFTQKLADFAEMTVKLIPYLDELAIAIGAAFAVNKIVVFSHALTTMIFGSTTGIRGMIVATRAFMAELTIATGGLYALVIALGAAVAGIAAYVSAQDETEAAIQRVVDAEKELDKIRQARAEKAKQEAEAVGAAQNARIGDYAVELASSGALTKQLERQLHALEGLTDQQIEAGLASGELFRANLNGNRVVMDATTALEMQNEALEEGAEAHRFQEIAINNSQVAAAMLTRDIGALKEDVESYNMQVREGGNQQFKFDAILGRYGDTVEAVTAKLGDLEDQLKAEQQRTETLQASREAAIRALAKREFEAQNAAAAAADADEKAADRAERYKKLMEELQSLMEKRISLQSKLSLALEDAAAGEEGRAELELKRKLEEIEEVFGAEIEMRKRLGRKTLELEEQMEDAKTKVRLTMLFERMEADKQATLKLKREIHEEVLAMERSQEQERASEIGRLRLEFEDFLSRSEGAALEDRLKAVGIHYDQIREINRRQAREIQVLTAGKNKRVLELEDEMAAKLAELDETQGELRLKVTRHYQRLIAEAIAEIKAEEESPVPLPEEEDLTPLQRFMRKMDEIIDAGLKQAGMGGLGLMHALGLDRTRASLSKFLKHTGSRIRFTFNKVRKDVGDSLKEGFVAGVIASDQFQGFINSRVMVRIRQAGAAIGDTMGGAIKTSIGLTGKLTVLLGKTVVVLAKAMAGLVRLGKGVANALLSVFRRLQDITGVSTDIRGMAADAQSMMDDRAALEEQIASGELSPEDQAAAEAELANMPENAAAAGAAVVTAMLDGAMQTVETLIAAAPEILRGLVEGIPDVLQALAEGIPGLVQTLIDELPKIVQGIVDGIGSFIQVLAASIPGLIRAFVEQLPTLIMALAEGIRTLIPVVAELIVYLVGQIPVLVEAILMELPTIIRALAAGAVRVIDALVAMLPELFNAIVAQLPALLRSLLSSVLTIAQALVNALIELVPQLIMAIPALIPELTNIIVMLVNILIEQLPTLLESLMLLIADVIMALVVAIPRVIGAIIRAIPKIISALIEMIPALIQGFANALPELLIALASIYPMLIAGLIGELVPALIAAFPELMRALAIELPVALYEAAKSLAKGLGEAVTEALRKLVQFFKDVISEIITLGAKKTDTFGDTPGAVLAGPGGMTARFAPGDTVIAAQDPLEALRQALDAAQERMVGSGLGSVRLRAPRASGSLGEAAAVAMLQAAEAMRDVATGGGAGKSLTVTVQADGRTLDEVMYRAGLNGNAPRLERKFRQNAVAAGVHFGFDRGTFNS